jgi:hypothetical protein
MTTLLILMPTGGHIDTPCVHSLMGLTQALSKRGIGFALRTYEWSDLVISRNYLLSVFLGLTKFSHALLLDSDMSFEPDLFFKLLDFDEDFTVAAYPQRRMPWAALRCAVRSSARRSNPKQSGPAPQRFWRNRCAITSRACLKRASPGRWNDAMAFARCPVQVPDLCC